MQEEVSFRELARVLFKRKALIVIFTVLVMLATGIINFFAAPVIYAATSYVTATPNSESTQVPNLNPFLSQVMSDVALKNLASKLELPAKESSLSFLRERINLSYSQESSLITVRVTHKSAETAEALSNQLAYELASQIEGTGLSLSIVDARKQLAQVNTELAAAQGETEKAEEELKKSAPTLETNQSLLANNGLRGVVPGLDSAAINELNGLSLKNEEVNPSYNDIEGIYVEAAVNLNKLTSQKAYLEKSIKNDQAEINDSKNVVFNSSDPDQSLTLTRGSQVINITPAGLPEQAVSKGTLIKTLLAGVLSFVLICMYVLFSHYLRDPKKNN